ncbi:hypothetical protein LTR66_006413 [Elasticomyces elasticus]|nr:hypothetical protein LTR66_006413 [Elasticomyces elasticus]
MNHRPEHQQIWRDTFPTMGFSHPFVLHGILAISALHLAAPADSAKEALLSRASAHHNVALSSFSAALAQISKDNCMAVFGFSGLTSLYALATISVQHEALHRGSLAVIKLHWDHLVTTELKGMLLIGQRERSKAPVPGLEDLDRLLTSEFAQEEEGAVFRDACAEAINLLQQAFNELHEAEADSIALTSVHIWLTTIPERFISLLASRHPVALVILAYLATLLHLHDEQWWLRGWGRLLMRDVQTALPAEMNIWLRWPRETIGSVTPSEPCPIAASTLCS